MELHGTATTWIARSPRDVLETVLRPELYALADHKVGSIVGCAREGEHGSIRVHGQLGPFQTPPLTLWFVLTPYRRLELATRSSLLGSFRAEFVCHPENGGTVVRHTERVRIPWLVGPSAPLRRWLSRDVDLEVKRLKLLLESEHIGGRARV